MADHPAPHPHQDAPGAPSPELQQRAVRGLATFLARWEDPLPVCVDDQDDVDRGGER
ncbi:hypothetical protein [Streptomyces sp. NPDC054854]